MTIYTPDFTPTYLYIKQHAITKKLYFGKTTKDPEKYLGSGTHWQRHIKKHGKEHILTLWYHLFLDQEELNTIALLFSEQQNIVESKDWLNIIPENGLDGRCPGISIGPHSDETKQKMSIAHIGKSKGPKSDEHKQKLSIANKGKSHSEETKLKISITKKGVLRSKETKEKISIAKKGLLSGPSPEVICPHCAKSGGVSNIKRYHFDNCKHSV